MYGRRSFLRRGLGLLSGGAAGTLLGRVAAASAPTEPYGASASPSPPAESERSRPAASILDRICEAADLEPTECEWWSDPSAATGPQSVLQSYQVLTVYGRSFGVAPVLGMLGALSSFDELERSVAPWTSAMSDLGEAPVMVAPHLIYGLATPCQSADDSCVIFLDASGVDLIEDYIKPAADRDMAVILDTQIGRLQPTYFVQRMIDAGYLAYPNVHIALDPEFATAPDQDMPGKPIGTLSAASINQAQAALAAYVREEGLSHKKVLIVHQFVDDISDSWSMVPGKQRHRDLSGSRSRLRRRWVWHPQREGAQVQRHHRSHGVPATRVARHQDLSAQPARAPIFGYAGHDPAPDLSAWITTPSGWRMWAPPHLRGGGLASVARPSASTQAARHTAR